ncbi:DUF411 domain-containing protein [Halorhodospira halophila]|uniref:Metal-binding protein n=1 Tax=Halorhodospira halophila (strain DSM 244 / SL1) TaxID=349124 RepID=A1WTQ7_HALHL|nr:DUF411 domain-containing protein [Halorhodospira halophila]ABM61069.1 protein of unknown function DUF411 [Halorhodospira halophila SL1]MBK1729786.1 metal-binding protein [Halorhodospira halophila]
MRRNWIYAGVLGAVGVVGGASYAVLGGGTDEGVVTVYKTPTCECCADWVTHLREEGFEVEPVVTEQREINQVRRSHGITPELVSCHMAVVDGYAVEGHVPAADIRRMLEEQPSISGLSVPGMPIGSPGMEIPGQPAESFQVLAFNEAGQTAVYSEH